MKRFLLVKLLYKLTAVIFPIGLLIVSSCNQKTTEQPVIIKNITSKPVILKMLKPPVVTLLDTCPPQTIDVPVKPGGTYTKKTDNGTKKINLLPPIVKPADFYIPMKQYNVEDGLALSSVTCSYCDKDGNLWFGTSIGGASCFNGNSFTNYTSENGLVDDQVFSIFQDKAGNFWFGTWNGITKYDGKTFKKYSEIYSSTQNLPPCCIYSSISQDKNNNIWIGSGGGLSKYDGKTFKNYLQKDGLANDYIYCILPDKKGNVWFGTDSGVSKYNGKSFINFTMANGLVNNKVSSLLEDNKGNIWFGTNGGLSMYNGDIFKSFTTSQGLIDSNVTSLLEDKNHHIWIGTKNGVSEYNGISFKNYVKANGLISNDVTSIVKDKNENIWFSTYEDGVFRYPGNAFINFTKAQGLSSNRIDAVFQAKNGILWFGTHDAGANKYDGKSFTNFTVDQGIADNGVLDIYEDKNHNLWFATYNGVSCYNGKAFTTYTTAQGLGVNTVWSITQDNDGNMWFGTFGGGISKLSRDKKSITTFTTAQGLTDDNIHEIATDKNGHIWLCNDNGGATEYDGKLLKSYKQEQGLNGPGTLAFWQDKNSNLWFGTGAGIFRYDGKSFLNFTRENGLPDNTIMDIKEDKHGIIWIGTRLGICGLKFKPKNNNALKIPVSAIKNSDVSFSNNYLKTNYEPDFETYNFKNGYPVKNINYTNSMFVDANNSLWAGTGDKLVRFDQKELYKNETAPTVFIQTVKINGEAVPWSDILNDKPKQDSTITNSNINEEQRAFGKILSEVQRDSLYKKFHTIQFDSITPFNFIPANLKLPYNHNDISFDFVAIEPDRPNLVIYQYMLEGYDKNWSAVTNKSDASFGNMHEGTYTFKVKAQSPDGIWSDPITYTFKVLPPWYRTWLAYIMYVALTLFLLWSFIRWRVKVLKKEKILLEQKIDIRTSQLKEEKLKVEGTLSELKLTQAQLIQSEKMASLGELTAGIAHEIQNPLNFVNNFSEVNKELVDELQTELKAGNTADAIAISNDIKENEQKINHHGKRADAIVKNMLQHSRTSTGQKEPTDINALADEYLRLSYHGMRAKDKTFNAIMKTEFDRVLGK